MIALRLWAPLDQALLGRVGLLALGSGPDNAFLGDLILASRRSLAPLSEGGRKAGVIN